MPDRLFELRPNTWHGWTMLPGYGGGPHHSPKLVEQVTLLKTGRSPLRLNFYNAGYAEGVWNFSVNLRIMLRKSEFLFADFDHNSAPQGDRGAIITTRAPGWLIMYCPWVRLPSVPHNPDHLQHCVQEAFFSSRNGYGN